MPRLLLTATTLLMFASPAAMASSADSSFGNSVVLASSTLSSIVTGATANFQYSTLNIGGNLISSKAFEGVTGVIAVSQNTGLNANIEQAVTVATGTIKIGLTQ